MIEVGDKIRVLLGDNPYVEENSVHEVVNFYETAGDITVVIEVDNKPYYVEPLYVHLPPNYYVKYEEPKGRPSFDEIFMQNAELMSKRSTCDRLHVGAVLVKDNHIIASGYNGSIRSHSHCEDVGHLMYEKGCKRTIHAEMNVLMMCARLGIPTDGTIMYVTAYPCPECLKHIAQAGIKKVYYNQLYSHRYENDFARDIELINFSDRK